MDDAATNEDYDALKLKCLKRKLSPPQELVSHPLTDFDKFLPNLISFDDVKIIIGRSAGLLVEDLKVIWYSVDEELITVDVAYGGPSYGIKIRKVNFIEKDNKEVPFWSPNEIQLTCTEGEKYRCIPLKMYKIDLDTLGK